MFSFGDSSTTTLKCSFCGKSQSEVEQLVTGPGCFICNECIGLCNEILAESSRARVALDTKDSPSLAPDALEEQVRAMLGGAWRNAAGSALCRVVSRHLALLDEEPGLLLHPVRSHVLITGPSGSGKTSLVRALQRALPPLPVGIVDVSSFTCTGFAGPDPGEALTALVKAADYDLKRAEKGVLVLDNADHLILKNDPRHEVQEEWLHMLEGGEIVWHADVRQKSTMSTRNVLFVVSGRFEQLPPGARMEDLTAWGLLPAFAARLPAHVTLEYPTVDDLVGVARQPDSAWAAYVRWLQVVRPECEVAEDAVGAVAEAAHASGFGAWGLQRAVEEVDRRLSACQSPELLDAAFIRQCGATPE